MKTDMLVESNKVYNKYIKDDVSFILEKVIETMILENNDDYLEVIANKSIYYELIWEWIEQGKIFYKLKKSKRQKRIENHFKRLKKESQYYKSIEWKKLRIKAIERDGFKCMECGSQNNLHVHHIKYKYKSKKLCDLITLCKYCHAKKHPINGINILM